MKSRFLALVGLLLLSYNTFAQDLEDLLKEGNYDAIVVYAGQLDTLTGEQAAIVGYAFFQLDRETEALKMYNEAIAKGNESADVYFEKGLCYRYLEEFDEAIKFINIGIEKDSTRQAYYSEGAICYLNLEKIDEALDYLYKARALEFETSYPYEIIPYILFMKGENDKALKEYYKSIELIDKSSEAYLSLLSDVAYFESNFYNNHEKAIESLEIINKLKPKEYNEYAQLIKAYNANENYDKADALFEVLKTEYERDSLPENLMKYRRVAVGEFHHNKQRVIVVKYFEEAVNMLDLTYGIYVMKENSDSITHVFMTERTIKMGDDGSQHLLCGEDEEGGHYTYPYGWPTDDIDYKSLKSAVIAILDGKLDYTASSKNGKIEAVSKDSKKKKKKKRKSKKNG